MKKTQKNQTRNIVIAVIAFIALIAVFVTAWLLLRPKPVEGAKTIHVAVVVDDAAVKSLDVHTDAEYLLEVLLEEDLIEGEEQTWGFWVTAVNGIVPDEDNQEWWALYRNGEFSMYGPDQTVVEDGDRFEYILTTGWDDGDW